ncbi:uncharacterized protein LOC123320399 [Coccinella septempunctata]|uniref:uncharacterized protein LOC123320399 n=1 Tax=Coccinella septempunctata TaxID=41139 RepID=UPI001D08E036|nr:uncharacterized protein LOC123320399 [Coccinella septempunctata]
MGDSMEIDEVYGADSANDSKVSAEKKRRSALWKYFTNLDDSRAKCNICCMVFSFKTSISNLKIHLQRKHHNVAIPGTQFNLSRKAHHHSIRKRPRERELNSAHGGSTLHNSDVTPKKWDLFTVKVAENLAAPEENVVKIVTPEKIVKESIKRDHFLFGCSDFSSIANKSWYVDKTLFVKSILKECDRLLITAPRRCAKTTNLNMVKKFVEIEVNRNGEPISLQLESESRFLCEQQISKNFNMFTDKKIFNFTKNGKIMFNKTLFSKHFGQYPVMHIRFRNVIGDSYKEVLASLRTCIYSTFLEHKYLVSSKIWDFGYSKSTFKRYIDSQDYDEIPREKLKSSLQYLSELLCAHYENKNKVYVLIDDLDAPINNIVQNSDISEEDSKNVVKFIKVLLSNLLKDNPYVERVLAMSSHHYADILISECNVIHKPYLQNDLCKYNGFTNAEVENLLSHMDLTDSSNEVKIWYNGYGMNLSNGNLVELYNNWSVMQYLYEKEFKNYQPVGSLNRFKNVLQRQEIKDEIEILVSRRLVTVKYKNNLSFTDVLTLKRMLGNANVPINKEDIDLFFQFLYEAGFLNQLYHTEESIELGIPNIEIYTEYCKFFFSYNFFKEYYNVTQEDLDCFVASLNGFRNSRDRESIVQLEIGIRNLFRNAKVLPQNDFELQALLYHFVKKYFPSLKGEALTMPKRYLKCDLGLPIDDKVGVIIEITTYDRSTSLDALSQIVANKYNEILSFEGLTDEVYIGLHLGEDRKITISYLVNNFDLAFAETVTSF